MKNKTIISFCINVLVGMLFTFPVFSADNLLNTVSSKKEFTISGNKLCINNISDSRNKSKKEFPENKTDLKNSSPKNNHAISSSIYLFHSSPIVQYFYHIFSDLTLPFKKNLHPDFTDISYLTELKITKMLC